MFAGSSPITFTSPSSEACQKSGPFAPLALPSLDALRPCPTPAMAIAFRNVEDATLATDGSPPITRTTFPTCRAYYPGGSSGCACRLLPRSLEPSPNGRRVGIRIVTFEACMRLHSRYGPPDRSATQGDLCHEAPSPASYPTRPLVSFRTYRQLSGWNPPPQVIRAFGAHCQQETHATQQRDPSSPAEFPGHHLLHCTRGFAGYSSRTARATVHESGGQHAPRCA